MDIGDTSLLYYFKKEYDKDYVVRNKEGGMCVLFTYKNIEIIYSKEEKDFVVLDFNNNEEEYDANEATKNQIKLINTKINAVK